MKFVDQEPPVPMIDNTPNLEYQTWWKHDQQVLGFLSSSISEALLSNLGEISSSKDLWKAIDKTFSSNSRSKIMDLQRRLHKQLMGNTPTNEYIQN